MSNSTVQSLDRTHDEAAAGVQFPDTMWVMVQGAADPSSLQAHQALESLCRAYWEPIYAFIRRTGKSSHDAEDLTQRFFIHLLEGNRLGHAAPEKGKFRSFLKRSIKNFLVDDWRCKPALERSGGLLEIDAERGESRYHHEPADELDPEKLFERVWARKVIELALARLRADYEAAGALPLFEHLHSFLPGNDPLCTRAEAAERLEMSATALDTAFHRMKKRFQEFLRKEIAETLGSPTKKEIESELAGLMAVFER
ncbi:MAG: sigma-70 family RNA polymerase sigma factor [Verrucomicrobia subdivision 3 bacterium]|nr:sigma-70 family RNA polymerase sigma factor [Limisphaerales bacterium]